MTSPKPSHRKKADLTPNNETFRLLFANHPIPMWVYELKTLAFLDVNDAALEKYGYTRDEFLSLTIKDIRPAEDVERLINNLEQKRPTLQHSGEWRHRLKNGQLIDVEITSHTLDFEGHKAVLVMAQDITERKQAEKALRDSELRFRSLIEHGLDNISLLAADGSLLWESPAVVHALGYEYDHFKGRNIFELMHPDDMEPAQLRFREIVSKPGNVVHSAFRLKHSNGSWRWMEGTGTNLLHVPSINAVVINYRDITESRQAEDFLQESARSLARAQRIGKLGDWDWDVQGNSLTWSDEIYRIWGVGKDFPLTFDSIAGMIHPDDREMNLKAVPEFLASRDEGEFEFRIICPDGTIKYIYQSIEVTRAPDGQPIKMFGIMQDITKRRQAEEALRESEERLRLANKATNDVIWDWDIVNDSQRWNEAGTVVFGWSDIVESPQPATWWVERVHPEDRQRVENSFFVVTADPARNYWHDEYRFRKMDGSYAQVIDRGYVLRNAQGEAVRMIGAMLDITERKQAEEALAESEKKLRTLFETMSEGIVYEDHDGKIISANPAAEKLLGLSLDQMQGRTSVDPCWKAIHADGSPFPGETHSLCVAAKTGKPATGEVMGIYNPKSDAYIWLSVNATPEFLPGEKKPFQAYAVFRDITARKQAEAKLQESEERFRQIAETIREVFYAYDPRADKFLYVSPAYETLWQEPVQKVYDDPRSFTRAVHPEDQERFFAAVRREREDGEYFNMQYRILRPDGTVRYMHSRNYPIFDASGVEYRVVGIAEDITIRERAERELQKLNMELEQHVEERTSELREAQEKLIRNEKLAVLGQLAGGVGHELRNPLAVINNAVYYLKLVGANGNEKVKEYLGIIETEAHTAEKIITDLLDFARIKSVDLESVSASRLVERVLERYPAPKAVSVKLEIPENVPMLYVDPRHAEQVLGNLVINACQAMMPSGGELTITAHQEQEMIAIAVRDTGVGISSENMKNLFEPLFTTKAKGIGLGLAVSRKLIEANGGRIEVQSEAGKGSTFTVYLPVKVEAHPL